LCRRFYGGGGGADRAGVISVSAILRSFVQYLGGRERGGLCNYCTSILNHCCVGAIILEGKTYDNWRQKNIPVDGPSYLVGRTDEKVLTMFCSGTNYRCLWTGPKEIHEFIYFDWLVFRQKFGLIPFSFPLEPQVHVLLYYVGFAICTNNR
jgi:hypothetical protein